MSDKDLRLHLEALRETSLGRLAELGEPPDEASAYWGFVYDRAYHEGVVDAVTAALLGLDKLIDVLKGAA